MLEINAFKTNLGILFHAPRGGYHKQVFNEEKLEAVKTWRNGWYLLRDVKEISSVYNLSGEKQINPMWKMLPEFIDKNIADLPLVLTPEEAAEYYDNDDYEWYISTRSVFYGYSAMYNRVYTGKSEAEYKPVEFKIKYYREVEITLPEEPVEFLYKTYTTHANSTTRSLSSKDLGVDHRDLQPDSILSAFNPEIFWHTLPCSITRETSYKIIREHIKANIDGNVARITSDYDFCLTVEKIIPVKPWLRKTEQLTAKGRRFKKPRFEEIAVNKKRETIFRIAPKTYQSYPVVDGFKANNLQELKETIDTYLQELMDVINTEVSECHGCCGTGHIVKTTSDTQLRDNL